MFFPSKFSSGKTLLSTLSFSNKFSNFPQHTRLFSTSKNKFICQYKEISLDSHRVITLFKERRLRQLAEEIKCPCFHKFDYNELHDCELVDIIHESAFPILNEFKDVVHIGNSRRVLIESLHKIPEGDLGSLTGDHGKQLTKFVKDCIERKQISTLGAVFDIGGGNTSTIEQISNLLNNQDLPCIIVDINLITPALTPPRSNVKYVIEDGQTFFASEAYVEHTEGFISQKPSLFIFNNMLNVLKPEAGWGVLEAAWKRMLMGDYLVISGLVPEQLKQHGCFKFHEVDGIVEFHRKSKGFYKSALSSNFFEYVENRLPSAKVLFEETFKFPIEKDRKTIDIKGCRLLTLKKT